MEEGREEDGRGEGWNRRGMEEEMEGGGREERGERKPTCTINNYM